ncbi:hypothetical protein [Ralstonia insidiosa]|uniref:hypothetical protein n=1 Tax=Ralstonia insidiosa TaxID=190721 RepID=UPI001FC9B394|nr:hypothetical protein [Ralstonia insidiosa]
MKAKFATLAAVLVLSGCVTQMNLSLLPRGPGQIAHGALHREGKAAEIVIGGHSYVGTWAYVQGGSFSVSTLGGTGGFATGGSTTESATGEGNIIASSRDAGNLRCAFNYSRSSSSGTGLCRLDDGSLYDLQLAAQ